MYIGGTSSYPSDDTSNNSDTILDLSTVNMGDFIGNCDGVNNTETNNSSISNVYDTVKAFKVCFGTQNQSMFYDIQIDSKEYPETNESIQILSQLAGDQGENAPIAKGQNLYNLYESRAYKATVNGMGNAMIQPTQYFQLSNVPMFNGAYMILSVEHNITNNHMTTTFSGVKIHKYPLPRITNPLAIVGADFTDGITTDLLNLNYQDKDVNTIINPGMLIS